MDGFARDSEADAGRRAPGGESVRPSGVWSRLFASKAPCASASDRCVGDRPLPGKETAATLVAQKWLLGLPLYEQLGYRAVKFRSGGLSLHG